MLALLGMIPGAGCVFDAINAACYFSEGNIQEGCLSLFGALPGMGDAAVAGAEALKICTRGAKIFRFAARVIGNAGIMPL